MTAETPVVHVTMAFGHGYGSSFSRLDAALTCAEAQMQSLLSGHENLPGYHSWTAPVLLLRASGHFGKEPI
jgi:hypothetical protein